MLTAYYDLAISPPTYEVVSFLLRVEQERRRLGEQDCRIVFVPGPVDGFRADSAWPPPGPERHRVFNDLAVPLCNLLPSCTGVEVARAHLAQAPVFGAGAAEYGHHNFVRAFLAVGGCLRPKKTLVTEHPEVTITLRESEHWPERNSNVPQWLKAADRITGMGFQVRIIRDDFHSRLSIDDRAALYRAAVCNLFVCNGPAFLAFAIDAPLLMFRPCNEFLGGTYSALHWEACGSPAGGQMPGSPSYQRIVWDTDDCDVIDRAFLSFLETATETRAA